MSKVKKVSRQDGPAAPVGFFDSGVGGLTVLQAARRLLPCENMLYFADSAHCPYGSKSSDFVRQRSLAISRFLLDQGAKAIVVACNSASEAALEFLRQAFPGLEIVGVEPAVKVAQRLSRNKKIGVLGTALTLKGRRFSRLLENFSSGMEVYTQPVAGLVERIEAGCFADRRTAAILEKNLQPLLEKGIDTLVLGCTHYPVIKERIAALCGPRIEVIDTGDPVARQLRRRLLATGLLNPGPGPGRIDYFSSGDARAAAPVLRAIMADGDLTVRHGSA
jgi:glutamate racemase